MVGGDVGRTARSLILVREGEGLGAASHEQCKRAASMLAKSIGGMIQTLDERHEAPAVAIISDNLCTAVIEADVVAGGVELADRYEYPGELGAWRMLCIRYAGAVDRSGTCAPRINERLVIQLATPTRIGSVA
jgi:hypothetical protein